MKGKIKKLISIILILTVVAFTFSGCSIMKEFKEELEKISHTTFEDGCVTTEDGFKYYVDKQKGLCLLVVPNVEELTIPEYIDGQRVMQLGYEYVGMFYDDEYFLDCRNVKTLIIKHQMVYFSVNFMNVETLVYNNVVSALPLVDGKLIIKNQLIGASDAWYDKETLDNLKQINLKFESPQKVNSDIQGIYISRYVKEIDSGVFGGMQGVTIQTEYESKPDGWQDGWNGDCQVEWGVKN